MPATALPRPFPAIVPVLCLALGLASLSAAEPPPFDPTARIDLNDKGQEIDGFGASTAWHGAIGDVEADAAFGNGPNQLGLTLLRVRIDPSPDAWADEKSNAQKAKARGARILATPWSPPAALKTVNSTVGGELRPDAYAAYAGHLKAFCGFVGNVDVVSVQNEPNIQVNYESCSWSGGQIRDFCKTQAGSIGVPVMMPEAFNFDPAISDPTLGDSAASAAVAYVGGHLYGARPFPYSKALDAGKRVWMTEYYVNDDNAYGMLQAGKQVLDCLVNGMHGYIWWYLSMPGCNLIRKDGSPMRKGFALAQFAKYIRPGYHRVAASYQPQPGVYVAAFQGGDQIVIVAVNQFQMPRTQAFAIGNGTLGVPRKFTSSAAKGLLEESVVDHSDSGFTATLDPQSITTFVATAGASIRIRTQRTAGRVDRTSPPQAYLPTGRRVLPGPGGDPGIVSVPLFRAP